MGKNKMTIKRNVTGEEIQQEILKFLSKNRGKEFNVLQIKKAIRKGYPATLKYVDVLNAKGLIVLKDYGNVKIVSFKGGNKSE